YEDNDPYDLSFNNPDHCFYFIKPVLPPKLIDGVAFKSPAECFKVDCSIHDKQLGVITVVPYPIFTRTKKDGSYKLPLELPVGNYQLKSFSKDKGRIVGEFEVKKEAKEIKLDLKRKEKTKIEYRERKCKEEKANVEFRMTNIERNTNHESAK